MAIIIFAIWKTIDILKKINLIYVMTTTEQFLELILNSQLVIF